VSLNIYLSILLVNNLCFAIIRKLDISCGQSVLCFSMLNLVVHRLPMASEGLTNITSLYVIYPVMCIMQGLLSDIDSVHIIYLNVLYSVYNATYHILNWVLK